MTRLVARQLATPEHKSGKIRFDVGGGRAYRYWACAWADKLYVMPNKGDWFAADMPNMICTAVEIEPIGDIDVDTNEWKNVIITAEYSLRPPEDVPSFGVDFSAEALLTTKGRTRASDNAVVEDNVAIYYPRSCFEWEYTLTDAEWSAGQWVFMNLTAHVNDFDWKGAATGTVRFDGVSARSKYNWLGEIEWRVSFRFSYNPDGWSRMWFDDLTAWDYFNEPVYPSGDFDALGL